MAAPTAFRRRESVRIEGNGVHRAAATEPRLATPVGRRSTTAIILAVLSLAGGALAGVIAFKAGSDRQSVLAASHGIATGHALQAGDLHVVDMSSDGGVGLVLARDETSIIGRTVGVPIAAGAPLTRSELGSAPAVGPGEAVVGVLSKAGQYPPSLAPGDTVEIVDTGAWGGWGRAPRLPRAPRRSRTPVLRCTGPSLAWTRRPTPPRLAPSSPCGFRRATHPRSRVPLRPDASA